MLKCFYIGNIILFHILLYIISKWLDKKSPSFENMSEGGEQPEKRERPMYSWVDVTAEFKNAASQLSLGELLHDSS